MSTTATRPQSKLTPARAYQECNMRGKRWADAEDVYRQHSRELAAKVAAWRALHDERHKLIRRDPQLVNHLDEPVGGKENPIRAIDAKLQKLGDLAEGEARVKHAKAHFPLVVEGRRTEAEQMAARVNAEVAETREVADEYLTSVRWSEGLCHLAGRSARDVPGLEAVAELLRVLEGWDLPAPIPGSDA